MDFFNTQDIKIFQDHGGKRYHKDNQKDQQIGQFIKDYPMAKTKHWAQEVANSLPGFTMEMKSCWQKYGYFSLYSWARIFRDRDKNRDIFFTVGVDREQKKGLVYKLDFQRDKSSKLPEDKKSRCDQLIRQHKLEWQTIDASELNNYDWDKLIDITVQFINDHLTLYDELIREAWARSARICWNTNNWLCPSGQDGKSVPKDSDEPFYGYNNEEWLFDFDKLIDGYHYASLESVGQISANEVGKKYDTLLWTIDNKSQTRYAVANIRNLEIIGKQEAANALAIYERSGWLAEMRKQIADVGGNTEDFDKQISFNIRFRPQDTEILYPAEIPANSSMMQSDLTNILTAEEKVEYAFTGGRRSTPTDSRPSSYIRKAREVEIHHLHREISDGLTTFLAHQYGDNNVEQESTIGNRRIDVVCKDANKYTFYEIKTYLSLRTSIREALGQLLEYAHYPEADNAHKLVIVTQSTHSDRDKQNGQRYIAHLRKCYGLSVYLCYFDKDKQELSEEF